MRGDRRFDALCAAAVLCGLMLRFYRLDAPLWLDEAVLLRLSSRPLGEIPAAVYASQESNPPLMYLLVGLWSRAFGGSDAALRALPALLGSLAVLVGGWAASRLDGRRAGLAAAALLALHPMHLAYSQELRPYAAVLLLSSASLGFFVEAARSGRPRDWLGFAGCAALALYSHYYALFALLGLAALAPRTRAAALAFGGIALCALPGLLALPGQALSLAARTPFPALGPGLLGKTAAALSGGTLSVGASSVVGPWPVAVLAAVWMTLRGARLSGFGAPAVAAAAGLMLPLLISAVSPIFLPTRHALAVLPFLAALWGKAVEGRAVSLAAVLALWAPVSFGYFHAPRSHDEALAAALASMDDGETAIRAASEPWRLIPAARYYPALEEAGTGLLLVSFHGRGGDEERARLLREGWTAGEKRELPGYARVERFTPPASRAPAAPRRPRS